MRTKAFIFCLILILTTVRGESLPESVTAPINSVFSVLSNCGQTPPSIESIDLKRVTMRPEGYLKDVMAYTSDSKDCEFTFFSSERSFSLTMIFPRKKRGDINIDDTDKLGRNLVTQTHTLFFSKSGFELDAFEKEYLNKNNGKNELRMKLYGGWFQFKKKDFQPYVIFIKVDSDGRLFEYTLVAPRLNEEVVLSTETRDNHSREDAIRAFLNSEGFPDEPFSVHDEKEMYEDLDLLGYKSQGVTECSSFQIRVGHVDAHMIALFFVRYSPVVGQVVYSLRAQ